MFFNNIRWNYSCYKGTRYKVSSQSFLNLGINSLCHSNQRCPLKYFFSGLKAIGTTRAIGNIEKHCNFVFIFLSLFIFSSLQPLYFLDLFLSFFHITATYSVLCYFLSVQILLLSISSTTNQNFHFTL